MKTNKRVPTELVICVALLSICLFPTSSLGATFCASNPTELQAALTTAESNGEDNTIKIVQGTYNGNFTYASTEGNSLTVEGGYSEGCVSRTIAPANTILDGGGTDMVLALVSQAPAVFSVEGLTLQNGKASTVNSGAGLYSRSESGGSAVLTNNIFKKNTSNGAGGGVYISTGGTLINNSFIENVAIDSGWPIGGGGAYVAGDGTLTNNTFTGNSGGGAYVGGNGNLLSNTFNGNTGTSYGGGAYVGSKSNVTRNIFTENIASYVGGGVYISDGGIVEHNTFIENIASGGGGGVYISGGSVTNNQFTGNSANNGGGVYVNNGTVTDNTFISNSANYDGGGVFGSGTLTNNTFTENSVGGWGGGCSISGTLTNNTFSGNTATTGGGAFVRNSTLTNNSFTGNSATTGGGVSVLYNGALTSNLITKNSSGDKGGGIYSQNGDNSGVGNTYNIILINNLITKNSSGDKGGGIYSQCNYYCGFTMTNNTIARNSAKSQGGGLWAEFKQQKGEAYNNILWDNIAPEGSDLYLDNSGDDPFFPVEVDLFNNDFDQSQSGTYMTSPFSIDISNLDNEDPLFVGNNDFYLTAASPCINTGDNDAPDLPTTDMEGNPRIVGGVVDMGAYEFQPVTYAYVNKDDETCGGKTPCYLSVQQAIDASSHRTVIMVVQGDYEEDITLNSSKTLTLQGGYASAFTTQSSNSTIKGSFVVGDGKLKTSKIRVLFKN